MSQGGPLTQINQRLLTHVAQIPAVNGFPVPLGTLVIASATVAIANNTTATPFSLVAGQLVHLQANSPVFVGEGPTSAIAKANALLVAKRLDAWEPFSPYLGSVNRGGNTQGLNPQNAQGQVPWFLAVVLQSAGSGILYVGYMPG